MSASGSDLAPRTDAELRAFTVGPLRLHSGPIVLVEYEPEWPRRFERERARIRAALGGLALAVEHVGSTAVPGLAAKPRIDVLLVVADSSVEEAYVPPLERAGYRLRIREPDWHEHRVLTPAADDVNVHVFSAGCPEIERMLAFRDHLRADAGDRSLYERTKRELAGRSWRHVQHYADAKGGVVEAILARALGARTPATPR